MPPAVLTSTACLATPRGSRHQRRAAGPRRYSGAHRDCPPERAEPLAAGRGGSAVVCVASGTGRVDKLNAEELEVAIAERDVPLIVDFYATWCGPCVLMARELETVAEKLGDKIRVVKVDTDENPELSSQLRIQGLPTLVFISTDASKPALRVEGLFPANTVMEILEKEMEVVLGAEATDA